MSLLGALIGASAALSACDIPPASFDGSGTGGSTTTTSTATGATGGGGADTTTTTTPMHSGGMGGAAGGTGGTGGETTTTTTTSTGGTGGTPIEVVLQCNYPNVTDCQPGQVCCLDKESPFEDKCAAPGGCAPPTDWTQAACAKDSHCTDGKVCCLNYAYNVVTMASEYTTYCDDACTPDKSEFVACETDNECLLPGHTCQKVLADEYTQYTFCFP